MGWFFVGACQEKLMGDKVTVVLPDGSKKGFSAGTAISQILRDFNPALAKDALAAFLNGVIVDLSETVHKDSEEKRSSGTALHMSWPRQCRTFSLTSS
jgi:hypothetical protein